MRLRARRVKFVCRLRGFSCPALGGAGAGHEREAQAALQVHPMHARPDEGSHGGVARAGGVDHAHLLAGAADEPFPLRGEHALRPHAEEHAPHACAQQRPCRRLRLLLAAQLLRLQRVGLEAGEAGQDRAQPRRLGGGDRVGVERHAHARSEIREGLGREVCVQHHGPGGVEGVEALLDHGGRDVRRHPHIRHGELHFALLVGNVEVSGAVFGLRAQAEGGVDPVHGAALQQQAAVLVRPHGAQEPHLHAQQAQVVGDVAPHAAGPDADLAGVGVLRHRPRRRAAADIHVHAAHDGDVVCHAILLSLFGKYGEGSQPRPGLRPFFLRRSLRSSLLCGDAPAGSAGTASVI